MARITIQDLNKLHPLMDSESYFSELTDKPEINDIRGGTTYYIDPAIIGTGDWSKDAPGQMATLSAMMQQQALRSQAAWEAEYRRISKLKSSTSVS